MIRLAARIILGLSLLVIGVVVVAGILGFSRQQARTAATDAAVATAAASTPAPLPALISMPDDAWTPVTLPLNQARCSDGSPYSFFAQPGDAEKLLIYFQGGGACWNRLTCAALRTFDPTVGPDEVSRYRGIFDSAQAGPFDDYTRVFIPYCTGDLHMGTRRAFGVDFNGYANAQAALAWTYANVDAPAQVVVTGESAGGYGALAHADSIFTQYDEAQQFALGDGSLGIIPDDWGGFETWGVGTWLPELETITADGQSLNEGMYRLLAERHPDALLGASTTIRDGVQISFFDVQRGSLRLNIENPPARAVADWQSAARDVLERLDMDLDRFVYFAAAGTEHTILPTGWFRTIEADGVRYTDWLAAFLRGEAVNVSDW